MTHRILVTGANGFLGRNLVRRLCDRPDLAVVCVSRGGAQPLRSGGDTGNGLARSAFVRCDLADREGVRRLFSEGPIDAVVHAAAAIRPGEDPVFRYLSDNVVAQANLMEAACEAGVARLVYCSTISVYGGEGEYTEDTPARPEGLYGWSKLAAEDLLRLLAGDSAQRCAVTLRFAGIHGPGREDGLIFNVVRAALRDEPIRIDDPQSRLRPVFVGDAVQAVLLALDGDLAAPYTCFNVAGGESFTALEFAERVVALTGARSAIECAATARRRDRVMNIDAARHTLGFAPRPLEENLRELIAFVSPETPVPGPAA